jgi:uncharacterized membrane protein YfcA
LETCADSGRVNESRHMNFLTSARSETIMLKFMAGLILGVFVGMYLATSFPRELGELFAWMSLVTLL